jgi:hypothetical protein
MTGRICSDVISFLLGGVTQEGNCLVIAELTVVMNTIPTVIINGMYPQLFCANVQLT